MIDVAASDDLVPTVRSPSRFQPPFNVDRDTVPAKDLAADPHSDQRPTTVLERIAKHFRKDESVTGNGAGVQVHVHEPLVDGYVLTEAEPVVRPPCRRRFWNSW